MNFSDSPESNTKNTINSSDVAVTSYNMDVEIFPENHQLKIKAAVVLTSNKKGNVSLNFNLRDEFKVERITQADKSLKFTHSNRNIAVEGIQVADNSPPLIFEYQGIFELSFKSDSMSDVIVYEDEIRLTYTSGWYPEPRWTSGHEIKPSSKLSVEVPDGFTVVSGDNQEQPPHQNNGRVYYQYSSRTHGSLSFAAAKFARTIVPWGGKTIEAYFFPKKPGEKPKLIVTKIKQKEEDVRKNLEIAKDIIDFYSSKFVTYPYSRFSLVQKSNYVGYAYGVQTYVVMNNLSSINEKTFAHEIAHQWWGNLIHPVGQGERWLTESLAEYSAFLYIEHSHSSRDVVADSHEFLLSQMENMHPIRQTSFDTPNYNNIVYKIGPHVFHMLRYVVGDEQFFEIIKIFAEKNIYKNATVSDFIEIAENVHGSSLKWFFSQWLDETKNPAFVLESKIIQQSDGTYLVQGAITQHNTEYKMPLEIEIAGENQREKQRIWVQGEKTPFEFSVSFNATDIRFTEEMPYWILADFFHSEQERQVTSEKKPEQPPSRSREELFELIRSKIIQDYNYTVGTEIEIELEAEQAVRLVCAENPYEYKEILICPMEGILNIYTFFTDGKFSGGGISINSDSSSSNTGRSMAIRNITVWEIRDDKIHIKFRTETDKEKIKQIFIERYKKQGKTAQEIEQLLKLFFQE